MKTACVDSAAGTDAGVTVGCPDATWVDGGNGQCYAVFTQTSPFTDALEAQTQCHSNGSELASIPDFATESLILEMLRNATVSC